MDKEDMVHTHTHTHTHNGLLLSLEKERNFTICSKIDMLGGHCIKWNKSDKGRQILKNSISFFSFFLTGLNPDCFFFFN